MSSSQTNTAIRAISLWTALLVALAAFESCDLSLNPDSSSAPIPGEVLFALSKYSSLNMLRMVGRDSLTIDYHYDYEISVYDSRFILDLQSRSQMPYPWDDGIPFMDLQNGVLLGRGTYSGLAAKINEVIIDTIPYSASPRLNEFGSGATYVQGDTLFARSFATKRSHVLYVNDSVKNVRHHLWRGNLVYFTIDSIVNWNVYGEDVYSISPTGGPITRLSYGHFVIGAIAVSNSIIAVQGWNQGHTNRYVAVIENGIEVYRNYQWFRGLEISGDTLYYSGIASATKKESVLRYVWR